MTLVTLDDILKELDADTREKVNETADRLIRQELNRRGWEVSQNDNA